jgi:hypothetical protein
MMGNLDVEKKSKLTMEEILAALEGSGCKVRPIHLLGVSPSF